MKNSYVLGICGHAGSGKDMVADYLIKELHFTKLTLAGPIKEIARIYFGIDDEILQRSDKPEKVRWLLQQLGTEIGRTYDPDVWVKCLCRRVRDLPFPKYVVSDVRFPNEAEAIVKELGGDLILIRRPLNPNKGTAMMEHASETSIEKIPFDLFRTAFLNIEDKRNELLQEVLINVKGWLECHNSRTTQE